MQSNNTHTKDKIQGGLPMKTKRIKASEVVESRFYKMPKWLIHDESYKTLSCEAKMLYMIMRDRHELSLLNEWIDEEGHIYIIYNRANMQEDLQVSKTPIDKAMKMLKQFGLIDEVRQGCNKPNLIYVLTVDLDSQWKVQNVISKKYNILYPNSTIYTPNETNIKDTNIKNTSSCTHENVKLIQSELPQLKLKKKEEEEIKTFDFDRLKNIIEMHKDKIQCFNYIKACYYTPIEIKRNTGANKKPNKAFTNIYTHDTDLDELEKQADDYFMGDLSEEDLERAKKYMKQGDK